MLLEISIAGAFACMSTFDQGIKGPTVDCTPALVGSAKTPTPLGVFRPKLALSGNEDYGPDVIIFKETQDALYLIHRPWKGSKVSKTYRKSLLSKGEAARKMSNGCVNVGEEFFDRWKDKITMIRIVK